MFHRGIERQRELCADIRMERVELEPETIEDVNRRDLNQTLAMLVRYERGSNLLKLASDPTYLRVAHHRAAALADYRLLMMDFNASGFA